MYALYEDILALTDTKPSWYDMNGVPRFAPFHPDLRPNIYAKEVILLEIQCQSCARRFQVELHWSHHGGKQSISEAIDADNLGYIHYGDPPRHGKLNEWYKKGEQPCCAGDTMNSEQIKILEFWSKSSLGEWERLTKYEIEWDE